MNEGDNISESRTKRGADRSVLGEAGMAAFIVDLVDFAIVQLDEHGIVRAMNRGAQEMKGYSPDELIGRHFSVFYTPEDREAGLPSRILDEARTDRRAKHAGWRVRKDGGRFWGEVVITAVHSDEGELIGFIKITHDLTERHAAETALAASEQRFRLLVDSVLDYAIIGLDPDGNIQTWNKGAQRLKGYTADEIIGRHFSVFYAEDDLSSRLPWRILDEARVNGSAQHSGWRRRKDGSLFWADIVVTALHSDAGEIVGFVKVTRDLTERHETDRQMAEARDQALRASQLKSEFVANMSHEIRTPMNGVIGMTDLLLRTAQTREQREYTLTVRHSAEALLGVINDILDFSKIEAGKLDLDQVDFEVRNVVEDVAALLAGAAQAKGLELVTFVDPAVPATVEGDPGRLRQVILNLAANAVKFTDSGEVLIRCDLPETVENSGASSGVVNETAMIRFQVRDTGPGIAPEHQERLFSTFTQVDASSTRRHAGTGLGLAISKRLVELMGGQIGLDSTVGEGSTFWFDVRLRTRPTARPVLTHFLKGLPILVVDDNATNRTILEQTLWGWDMAPDGASDAVEALEKLRHRAAEERPYQLALIDYHMPDVDGIELARLMAGDERLMQTQRVLLTSTGERGDVNEGLFEAVLTKPVRHSVLFDAIALRMGEATPHSEEPSVLHHPVGVARQRGIKVLVAEDNPVNQTVSTRMLETLGYEVDIVADGAEAVEAAIGNGYAMVLMDCQMPKMDGYEATRKIREREAGQGRVPVIAMTAGAMEGDVEQCLAAGMDDYISKPVTLDRLQSVIERWTVPIRSGEHPEHGAVVQVEEDVIDLTVFDALQQLSGVSDLGLHDMVRLFIETTSENLDVMEREIRDGRLEEVGRLAHTIKGSAGVFGAQLFAGLCQAMTDAARRDEASSLPAMYEQALGEFVRVKAFLESRLDSNT